ncbi:hypothetical protein BDZ97DRAFT_1826863 [Flammula alnicola]|nr:hypothetical protein BDZ97DRAFT_1826863 [Flammula alnicola]
MLINANASISRMNRVYQFGDARNSMTTLPSEEETGEWSIAYERLRDMLRALKISQTPADAVSPTTPPQPAPMARVLPSTMSLSTRSLAGSKSRHRYLHPRLRMASQHARPGSSSTRRESMRVSMELDRGGIDHAV